MAKRVKTPAIRRRVPAEKQFFFMISADIHGPWLARQDRDRLTIDQMRILDIYRQFEALDKQMFGRSISPDIARSYNSRGFV